MAAWHPASTFDRPQLQGHVSFGGWIRLINFDIMESTYHHGFLWQDSHDKNRLVRTL